MATKTETTTNAAVNAVVGSCNDARLYDGWRTYGDAWVCRYLAVRIRRGAELRPGVDRGALLACLDSQGWVLP